MNALRVAAVALAIVACAAPPPPATLPSPSPAASPGPVPTPSPAPARADPPRSIAQLLEAVSPDRLYAHVQALAAFESRDPRHPGHAKAIAYLEAELARLPGVRVDLQRFAFQGIPMTNVLATIDPPSGAPASGWVLVLAHYDSIAKATPGWRPAVDPAPGANDNGTGTSSLLELARILSEERSRLKQRVVIGLMDGEELFFKGSAAYLAIQPRPIPFANVLNIDFVGSNALADRLDLIWYTQASAALRDRVIVANDRYGVGVAPLLPALATDPNVTIMDIAPWGLAGVPAVAVTERYPPERDATYPGNTTFHTVNDTPESLNNRRLWRKATQLVLAVLWELAS
ncbi:MAG: Zn-dependent exopeptidase M28 [Chloroflexi bacterium]|nr:Zn-dependent exopeptidase M28 [Chloroflexota bacterium]